MEPSSRLESPPSTQKGLLGSSLSARPLPGPLSPSGLSSPDGASHHRRSGQGPAGSLAGPVTSLARGHELAGGHEPAERQAAWSWHGRRRRRKGRPALRPWKGDFARQFSILASPCSSEAGGLPQTWQEKLQRAAGARGTRLLSPTPSAPRTQERPRLLDPLASLSSLCHPTDCDET